MGERDRQPPARNRAAIFGPYESPLNGRTSKPYPQAHPKRPSSLMKVAALGAFFLGGFRVFVLIAGYA